MWDKILDYHPLPEGLSESLFAHLEVVCQERIENLQALLCLFVSLLLLSLLFLSWNKGGGRSSSWWSRNQVQIAIIYQSLENLQDQQKDL